jgi:4-amino-4-deoxy-L-arabinose transferase-like glycosyltransferase
MTTTLGLLVLLAAAARFWRLDFDLPEVIYIDSFKFVGEAARMVDTGDLRPADFQYPGLYTHLLAALYRVFDIESVYGRQLTATCVSSAAGTLVVAATGWAARAVTGPSGTLLAVALACASPALVTQSRTPAPDTLCVLFATIALGIAARQPASLRSWAAAGLATGLAMGSKWTGAFVAPAVAVAAAVTVWRRRGVRSVPVALLVCGTSALVALWASTPFLVGLRDGYVHAASVNIAAQRGGQIGRVQLGPLDYLFSGTPTWEAPWLGTSLIAELGLPAMLLAAGGVAVAASGRLGFAGVFYAATALAYLVSISGTGWIKAMRFLLPCLPLLWVLAGSCGEWILARTGGARLVVGLALAVAALAAPARSTVTYLTALSAPSTNALAREWVRRNVPADSVVFLGPFFTNDMVSLPLRLQQLGRAGSSLYRLPPEVGISPERQPIYSADVFEQLRRRGVEWFILNSYFDDAFTPVSENLRFFPRSVREYEAFMNRVREEAELVHAEIGWADHRLGPDIRVWRLRPRPR